MEVSIIDSTLAWLFERYLENPEGIWNLADHPSHTENPDVGHLHNLGRYLVKKGFVKNHEFVDMGFTCAITTLGISRVSDGLDEVKLKILQASIENKTRSMVEILKVEPSHFRKVLDYATYLKRLGFIECIFHSHDVYAEPTYFGREWYEANRIRLVN
jgi:hypothetical protein